MLAVPGLNTTEEVALKEDLVKVKYEFEFGSVSSPRTRVSAIIDLRTGIG